MQGQPSGQTPQTPPNRPERVPPPVGPVRKQTQRTNWLPILFGGGIALALVCAVAFVIYSFFFFKPEVPQEEVVEVTPTLEVVKFAQSAQPVANVPAAPSKEEQPQAPQPENAQAQEQNAEQPAAETQPGTIQLVDDSPQQAGPLMTSPDYGIHAFLYWRPEVAERDLQLIEDAGFAWVKQEFPWREIEGASKGIFNWDNTDRMLDQIEKHNLKVLARVGVQPAWAGGGFPEIGPPDNYQDYGDFLFALASRYKGRIQAYQIWNEPNLSREWGERPPSPAEYTELLKIAYNSIKQADPNALIISAGLAPTTRNDHVAMPDTHFVQGLYDAGAQPYFDMLGVHGAGYKAPPEMDPGEIARDPNFSNPGDHEAGVPEELRRIYGFRHVEDVRDIMVRNGDADKRVVVLEFGWTTDNRENSPYRWHHIGEQRQGEYFVRAFQYAKDNWQPWIGLMTVIYMPDPDWTRDDEQWYWSIVVPRWPDAWPRPAYWMIKDMPK